MSFAPLARLVDAALEVSVVGSFTRLGPELRSRLEGWEELAPLGGRRVLITGATSGLGRAAALRLAGRGAHLHLVGRNPERLAATARDCRAGGAAGVHTSRLDLSGIQASRDWAAELAGDLAPLHALIHNAGALDHEYDTGPEGVETTMATHVLSPLVITAELLGALVAAPGGRVITVSSGGMYTQQLAPHRLEMSPDRYDGTVAYARAKRAQVHLNEVWARRVPELAFAAMHPGWADTPGVSDSLPGFSQLIGPLLRPAEQGADTIAWLATSDEVLDQSGRFWHDRRPRSTVRLPGTGVDDRERELLWSTLVERAGATCGIDIEALVAAVTKPA